MQKRRCVFTRATLAILSALSGGFACPAAIPAQTSADRADVVIYGGTSAGIAAAIQVVRMGRSAILIEPGQHVGGLTSGGLGFTDSGDKRVIGGIAREFYQRIHQHYEQPAAWKFGRAADYDRYRPDDDAMWTFEPGVAEQVFRQMLADAGVVLVEGERLDRTPGRHRLSDVLQQIQMESGRAFSAGVFIDATYEGDLMDVAGVTFTIGREANSQYGETLNGNQVAANTHSHRFVRDVDPWIRPGDPSSGLLPGIESAGAGDDGTADGRVQAYCYRMCMSNVAANRVPFPKPADYQELQHELLFRNFEAGDLRLPLKPDMMPNGKTDTNNNCAVSTDFLGASDTYATASYDEREEILRAHRTYQQGLMWSLANHPRVPSAVREQMSQWGLAADEFTDSDHWPHQIYVREARRMVSDYVVTELDCRRIRVADDSVGLGSYNMDSHNVRRYVTDDGWVQNEGDVQVSPGGAYLISYRSLIPSDGETQNLLVPVCLSASHIAYGSIRMEPVFMVLGQSAATAAVLSLDRHCTLRDLPYSVLRTRLLADRQVLDLPQGSMPKKILTVASLAGVAVDNSQATLTGGWSSSSSIPGFIEADYQHDGNLQKGDCSATYTLTVPSAGRYEVRISYTANPNRASNVPLIIHHADGNDTVLVDQRMAPEHDRMFHTVGTFAFSAGAPAVVEFSNAGTDGHVIIDAVQLLPVR